MAAARLFPTWTRGAVLCFHSLTTPKLPSASIVNVPLALLERLVERVRLAGDIVPLRTLLDRVATGRSTRGLVALTFDDAYASLLTEAAPLFRRRSLPITVFVTTRATRTGARFWWDRVDDLFVRVARDRWHRFEDAVGLPAAYREGQPAKFGPLRPLRQWVLATFRGRWPVELEAPLAELEEEVGHNTAHRAMTAAELTELTAMPGVELGAHTVSHPVLPLLDDDEMADELVSCRRALEAAYPSVLPVLAIPFGLFDARTLRIAAGAGFEASLSLVPATIRRGLPRHPLPRFSVRANEMPWKLLVKLTGLADAALVRRNGYVEGFPALPSPTT